MLPKTNEWLEIVRYYMFHDIPRLMLVRQAEGQHWILDCKFSETLDDFSDFYSVFFVGSDQVAALAYLEKWESCVSKSSECVVQVTDLKFDSTKRKACYLERVREVELSKDV